MDGKEASLTLYINFGAVHRDLPRGNWGHLGPEMLVLAQWSDARRKLSPKFEHH